MGITGENKGSVIKDVYWNADFKTLTHLFTTGLLRAFNVQTSMWIPEKGREYWDAPPSFLMMVPFLFLVEYLEGWVFKAHTLGNALLALLGYIYISLQCIMNTCKALIIVTSLISLMLGVLFYFHFHDSLIPCILLLPLKDEHIELF